jgi:hypothetical protein
MIIAVDAMGGDHAPRSVVEGAVCAARRDGVGVLHLDEEVLDTEPLLVEQLHLAVPMKPVCRPDCKGLCPHCGADRNRGECDCRETDVDPRWAALAKLRQPGGNEAAGPTGEPKGK